MFVALSARRLNAAVKTFPGSHPHVALLTSSGLCRAAGNASFVLFLVLPRVGGEVAACLHKPVQPIN